MQITQGIAASKRLRNGLNLFFYTIRTAEENYGNNHQDI